MRGSLRHLTFAVSFCLGSVTAAAVIESKTRHIKPDQERWKRIQTRLRELGIDVASSSQSALHSFWAELRHGNIVEAFRTQWHSFRSSERTVACIIAANAVVFVGWRIPRLMPFMMRHFVHSPTNPPHTLFTSMLSHSGFLHFAFNMFGLWSFGRAVHEWLGAEQFLAVYASAGVLSSLASHLLRARLPVPYTSLGASGALYALLAVVAARRPDAQVGLVFLPVYFPIGIVLPTVMAVETAVALLFRRSPLDHYAHIAGALFGYGYMYYVKPLVWDNRDALLARVLGRDSGAA